ncbi:MAG: DHH family phosphoesterase [Euryarchaeota archaeon]|nr:DHH family phosphoesterase [Euryarchaeota archaeon]
MDAGAQLPDKLLSRIYNAKEELERSSNIRIISHYDADGISSAGILCSALLREGKQFHTTLVKGLTDQIVQEAAEECELLIFSDMGSSNLDAIEESGCKAIILDHHGPPRDSEKVIHVNPHLVGIDGMTSASASAICMLFAINLDERNWDLLHNAFAGIVGDRQAIRGLSGVNKWLFDNGLERNFVKKIPGSLYPLGDLQNGLYSSTDPYIYGVSGNHDGVEKLLSEADIEDDISSQDLSESQGRKLSSLIALKLVEQGVPMSTMEEVIHERYFFPHVNMDAGDLASLLNACGRSNNESIGLALTLGDPDALEKARDLRAEYVDEVLAGLDHIAREGVSKMSDIQYFINKSIGLSGILSGVTMQYIGDRDKPTIAMSEHDEGIKISSRATFQLLDQGVDLAIAMRESAAKVGGFGGGHRIAAGATVPKGREEEFLSILNDIIKDQKESIDA